MSRKRLTEASVLKLQCRPQAYRVHDVGTDAVRGLHVLVQPSGTRTYQTYFRLGGKRRTIGLGRVEELTLDEARLQAQQIQRDATRHHADPRKARGSVGAVIFEAVVEQWCKHQINVRNRVPASVENTKKFVLSSCKAWCGMPMSSIKEADIGALLSAKRDSGRKHAANRLYAHLRSLFKWAKRNKLVPTNEALEIERPWQVSVRGTRRWREWFVSDKADTTLKALWRAADHLGGDRGRFVKLLMITGKRINAIENMRWEHIDSAWFWRPDYASDAKRNQAIPLPKLAQQVLHPRQPNGPVFARLNPQSLVLLVRRRPNVPDDFFWQGLRHVMATKLAELRIEPHVARLVCDHVSATDAHSGYDHAEHRDAMLAALEKWCAYIERLIHPSANVAVLR